MKKTIFIIALVAIAQYTINAQSFEWAKKAGGTTNDRAYGIDTDASGNSYVTGTFQGTASFGSTSLTAVGWEDIFIAKLNSNGDFLWAKRAAGSAKAIASDALGNCYVTGSFSGTADFGSITLTASNSGFNIFIAKLDTNGNFIWAIRAGGETNVISDGLGITSDASGNCYITGYFGGVVNFGDIELTATGATSAFFAKIDMDGNFLWAKKAGGQILDTRGYDIATDASGNCYATGYFRNEAYFGSTGLSGTRSGFITKLDTEGNFLWTKRVGGTTYAESYGIATDASGNSYITGYFSSTAEFGSTTLTAAASGSTFITKLNTGGNFLWATKTSQFPQDIAIDSSGNSYVTGRFTGTAEFGSTSLTATSDRNIFVLKADSEGEIVWAKRAGRILDNVALNGSIGADALGNCFVTGYFEGTADFGTTSLATSGAMDVFIFKIGNGTASVFNETSTNRLTVFPNPANSILNVQSHEDVKTVSIYNAMGALVQTETRNSFSIEHLSTGVYMVLVKTENETTAMRFVKK